MKKRKKKKAVSVYLWRGEKPVPKAHHCPICGEIMHVMEYGVAEILGYNLKPAASAWAKRSQSITREKCERCGSLKNLHAHHRNGGLCGQIEKHLREELKGDYLVWLEKFWHPTHPKKMRCPVCFRVGIYRRKKTGVLYCPYCTKERKEVVYESEPMGMQAIKPYRTFLRSLRGPEKRKAFKLIDGIVSEYLKTDELEVLCARCHWKAEHGELSRGGMRKEVVP